MIIKHLGKILPEPNGCGPEGFQHLIPNLIFKRACNLHDNLFSAKAGFFASNWKFYMRMRFYIKKERCVLKSILYEPIALIYFIAVSFGYPWYANWFTKINTKYHKCFNIKKEK